MDGGTAPSANGLPQIMDPHGLVIDELVRKRKVHQSLPEPLTSPRTIQIECSALHDMITIWYHQYSTVSGNLGWKLPSI